MVQPVGPGGDQALSDSLAMRRFVEIDLGRELVPGEITMCRFRHLLEAHDLGRRLFRQVQRHLFMRAIMVRDDRAITQQHNSLGSCFEE